VAVGAEFGRAAVGLHGLHGALGCIQRATLGVQHPIAAELQIDQVALFQVHDLVGDAGQGHGVAGKKVLSTQHAVDRAHTQHQRRAGACAHHAVGFVFVKHRQRVGAVQLHHGGLQRGEHVAFVE